jgi:hypothetical protein
MTKSKSALAAQLTGTAGKTPVTGCRLCEKLETLNADDAAALRGALERGVSVENLYDALRDNGQTVPRRDITKHKKGSCI